MSRLPDLGAEFSPEVLELILYVTIVTYPQVFPDNFFEEAQMKLLEAYGRTPTLDDLAAKFGREPVASIVAEFLEHRKAEIDDASERMGIDSPCHLCGAARSDDDPYYEFALARDVQTKRSWGGFLAKMALNVVTVPLGVALVSAPGTTVSARLARCRLVLCRACAGARTARTKVLQVSEAECRRHPSWARLTAAGYAVFYDAVELADFRD